MSKNKVGLKGSKRQVKCFLSVHVCYLFLMKTEKNHNEDVSLSDIVSRHFHNKRIKYDFPFVIIRKVPRDVLKFDRANVKRELKNS